MEDVKAILAKVQNLMTNRLTGSQYPEMTTAEAIEALEARCQAGEDATDKLREAYKELDDRAVAEFCDELLALDAGSGGHNRWPASIHSNGQRLSVLMTAIKERRDNIKEVK